jgi:hypothetical protein
MYPNWQNFAQSGHTAIDLQLFSKIAIVVFEAMANILTFLSPGGSSGHSTQTP